MSTAWECYWHSTRLRAISNRGGMRQAAERSVGQAEKVLAKDPSNGAAISFGRNGLAVAGQN